MNQPSSRPLPFSHPAPLLPQSLPHHMISPKRFDKKNQKTGRKRASRPKVRTGCQTCKYGVLSGLYIFNFIDDLVPRTRHVKCDETRPSCLRCLKVDFECDFLLAKSSRKDVDSRPKVKPLAPKPTSTHIIFHPPSRNMFRNERERRSFQYFCQKTAHELSGCYATDLWRLILQACERDTAICHAVIAIGALDLTSNKSKPRPQLRLTASDEVEQDHRFALQQHGIAIRQMRESTSAKKSDLRTMLIGCILLTCFETFHGNHQSAVMQIQSGLNLIEDWYSKVTSNSDHLLGTSSPSPYILEDEIVQAFGRLDVHCRTLKDSLSPVILRLYLFSSPILRLLQILSI